MAIKKLTYCISIFLFILAGRSSAQPGFNIAIHGPETGAMRQDALGNFWVGIQGSAHYFNQFGELLRYADTIPHNVSGFTQMQRVGNDMYCMSYVQRGLINLYKIDYKGHFTWITEILLSQDSGYKSPYHGQLGFYVDERYQQIILHGLYTPLGGVSYLNGIKKDCAWWRIIDYQGKTLYDDTYCTPEKNTFAHHVLPHPQTGGYVLFCDKGNDFQYNESEKAFLIGLDSTGKRVKINDEIDFYISTNEMNRINNPPCFLLLDKCFLKVDKYSNGINSTSFISIDKDLALNYDNKLTIDSFFEYYYSPLNTIVLNGRKLLLFNFISYDMFEIINTNGEVLSTFKLPVPENTIITDLGIANDGGIYGCGWSRDDTTPWVITAHIFKLDSNGNLNEGARNPEIDLGLMLQPNPAQNQVYLRIPYDIGMVEATFYDMHGKKVLETKQMSDVPINIQGLQNGLYIIKAKSRINGVERTFKMEKL